MLAQNKFVSILGIFYTPDGKKIKRHQRVQKASEQKYSKYCLAFPKSCGGSTGHCDPPQETNTNRLIPSFHNLQEQLTCAELNSQNSWTGISHNYFTFFIYSKGYS